MSAQHTPGPIREGKAGTNSIVSDNPVPGMGGSDCIEYYGGHLIGESITPSNRRRLVACWNACEGIPTEVLERLGTLDRARVELDVVRAQSIAQRDELLALLDEVRRNFTRDDDLPDDLLPRIDAAIDKSTGSAA